MAPLCKTPVALRESLSRAFDSIHRIFWAYLVPLSFSLIILSLRSTESSPSHYFIWNVLKGSYTFRYVSHNTTAAIDRRASVPCNSSSKKHVYVPHRSCAPKVCVLIAKELQIARRCVVAVRPKFLERHGPEPNKHTDGYLRFAHS